MAEDWDAEIAVDGKTLVCVHCQGTRFVKRQAQLNTSFMTFFDLDWLNQSAEIFVCTQCGRIEWFLDSSGNGDALSSITETTKCLACGNKMPAGTEVCSECGWTYKQDAQDD